MNTLRLENINLHAPYRVLQDPERSGEFVTVTEYPDPHVTLVSLSMQ